MTPFDTVKSRVTAGKRFCKRFADKERRACKAFLDSSAMQLGTEYTDYTMADGQIPEDQPEGQVNYLTINTLVKTHYITITDPEFAPVSDDADSSEVVRQGFKAKWKEYGITEETRAAYQHHEISGHGFIFYRWSPEWNWPAFEWCPAWDMAVDPHVTATKWKTPRWMARRIRMPLDEFQLRYPDAPADALAGETVDQSDDGWVKRHIEVWIYWDKDTETHMKGEETMLKQGPNLYGRVPVLGLFGEINPLSPWRLGTFDLARGQQKMLSDLTDLMNHQAKHGGSVTAYNSDNMDDEVKKQFETGRPQGAVDVPGGNFDDTIKMFPAEPINPALIQTFELALKGMDATTAVNQYMRGVQIDTAKFATEIAAIQATAGSRGLSGQKQYEALVNEMAEICRVMYLHFAEVSDDEDYLLWQAMQAVEEVKVLESSTVYRDPSMEQQAAITLFNTALAAAEPMAMQGTAPNLAELFMWVMRAWNKNDAEKYLMPVAPPPDLLGGTQQEGGGQEAFSSNGAGSPQGEEIYA